MTSWPPNAGQVPGPNLRVSDAERTQVADALSKHFADGRLDQAEFDERMQRAMGAKTRGDLAGLFDDLPPLVPTTSAPPESKRRPGRVLILFLTVSLCFMVLTSPFWAWHVPWLLVGLVAFLLWRRHGPYWHHHRHLPPATDLGSPPPWVYGRWGRRWW